MYDPFNARDTFDTGAGRAGIYRLTSLEDAGLLQLGALPYSIRVLLEAVLRNCDGYEVREEDVRNLARWNSRQPTKTEVPFKPDGTRPVYCKECYQKHAPPKRERRY